MTGYIEGRVERTFLMTAEKKKLLIRRLLETAFLYSETPKFPLASGKVSSYYIDCKKALSHADVRAAVGDLILEKVIAEEIDAVGGLLLGAFPVAFAVSDAAAREGRKISAFAVRKEAKGHGLKKFLEGDVEPGQRVLVVEDVVTSGKSTILAIERCRAQGLEVVSAVSMVDRQEEEGRENIEKTQTSFDAILTIDDLLALYQKPYS